MLRVTRLRLSCSGRMTDLPSHFVEIMYVRDYRIVAWAGIEPACLTAKCTVAVRHYHLATMRSICQTQGYEPCIAFRSPTCSS